MPGVKNVIAVGAGKGGVGKTTVAVNLALALAQHGQPRRHHRRRHLRPERADDARPARRSSATDGEKIVPAEQYGLQVVSMGFLTSDDAPVIWRGPMLHGVIKQFFHDVRWDDLDYLIVDMPPGTGDVALSLSQTAYVAGAIVVTTPQQVSLSDTPARRGDVPEAEHPGARPHREHELLRVPVVPPRERHLRARRRRAAAEEMEIPFLGRIPISEPIRDRRRHRRADLLKPTLTRRRPRRSTRRRSAPRRRCRSRASGRR